MANATALALNLKDGLLDTHGMPLDPCRGLPIPDMMHQVKAVLNGYKGEKLTVIVEREQEMLNLEKITLYRGYDCSWEQKEDYFEAVLSLKHYILFLK